MAKNREAGKILIFLVAAAFCGCVKNYRSEFLKQAKAKGWTEEQQLAALAYSDRLYFTVQDSSSNYKPNYSRLSKARVREKLDKALQDMDQTLGYENEENYRYIDALGLRKSLEREEEVIKAMRDLVRTAELYEKFQELTGMMPYNHYGAQETSSGYDPKIFVSTNLLTAFPFAADHIEGAKKNGSLRTIEQVRQVLQRKLDRKEKNPASPDDPNDFIWKSKNFEIEFISYKILGTEQEKPEDNFPDYLEGYRIAGGKRESLPILRIIYFDSNARGAFLLDTDREDETGFGLPDVVLGLTEPLEIADLLNDQSLLDAMFEEKKTEKRVPPKPKPVFVEIASVKQIDSWEEAPTAEGWKVPFRYHNPLKNNYNVRLVFAKPEAETLPQPNTNKQLKYLKKEWVAGNRYLPSLGQVIEYYEMKPPYDQRIILQAQVVHQTDTKKVSLILKDGDAEQIFLVMPGLNKIIRDEPVMIEYTDGQKRWRLKRDSGGRIFNKRKEISPNVKNATGIYTQESETE